MHPLAAAHVATLPPRPPRSAWPRGVGFATLPRQDPQTRRSVSAGAGPLNPLSPARRLYDQVVDRKDLEAEYKKILASDSKAARTIEAKLRALDALQRLDAELDVPASEALLTLREVAALRDCIVWPEPFLWDAAQRAVVLKLGLWTEKELDAEVEAVRPRRTRRH
jgi:hypothetical protein